MTSTTYTLPDLITLPTNKFDVAPEFKPELTCLDQGPRKSKRYAFAYRVCYLDRRSLDPDISSISERKKVNLSSLCIKRACLIQPIIKGLLEGYSSIPPFQWIETAFDWIDLQGRSAELYCLESARKLYRDYTDHINHRLRLSNVGDSKKSIGYSLAQKLQNAFAYICGIAGEYDPVVVHSWAIRIPQRKIGLNELPTPATTADEHALAHALHQRYFEAFSQAILNNIEPPVVVKLTDLGFEDLIFYNQQANNANSWSTRGKSTRTDWQSFFFRREGLYEGKPSEFNALLVEHGVVPIDTDNFRRLQRHHRHFNQRALRELANYATRHFGYLLMAEAGNNAAHLSSINCQSMRLDRTTGLAATYAIKGRAGFEQQQLHVNLHFAQTTWKQYLKLRNWMTQQLEAPPESGLFLLNERPDRVNYTLLSCSSIRQLGLWPANAPSLATRTARKHRSVNLLEGSGGNIALVAGMQCATTSTIERHYNFKNREEAAKVMSDYFAAQAKAAELRHMGIKPVRIIENGEATLTGMCDSHKHGPRLIDGFEGIAIEPRCSAPITCIFCVHFGLHADIEDILRLLTIKLWIEVQSRLNSIHIDEHFQKFTPYLNRLQQIFEDLSNMSGETSDYLKQALTRFEHGERDQYWFAKINALLETQGA